MDKLLELILENKEIADMVSKGINISETKKHELDELKKEKQIKEQEINKINEENKDLQNEINKLEEKEQELENTKLQISATEKELKKLKTLKLVSHITGIGCGVILPLVCKFGFNLDFLVSCSVGTIFALTGGIIPTPFYQKMFEYEKFLNDNTIDRIEISKDNNKNKKLKSQESFKLNEEKIELLIKEQENLNKQIYAKEEEVATLDKIQDALEKGFKGAKGIMKLLNIDLLSLFNNAYSSTQSKNDIIKVENVETKEEDLGRQKVKTKDLDSNE